MKIAIDLVGTQTESRNRGIGRYTRSLTKALMRRAPVGAEVDLILSDTFPDTLKQIRSALSDFEDRIRVFRNLPACAAVAPTNASRRQAASAIREMYLRQNGYDLVLTTSLFEGFYDDAITQPQSFEDGPATAAILYDLIPLEFPEAYLPSAQHKAWFDSQTDALRRCDLLFAISEHTRSVASQRLGIDPTRIVTIDADADAIFRPMRNPGFAAENHAVSGKFILLAGVVSEQDPRKNTLWAIDTILGLERDVLEGLSIVVAGKISDIAAEQIAAKLAERGFPGTTVKALGHVSDAELVDLFNSCELFVFPSLSEGFGLPVLEAMRCGAAVLASGVSSIPEITGADYPGLFDPHDAQSLRDKLRIALTNADFVQSLRDMAQERSERFSWDRSAATVWSAVRQLIDDRPAPDSQIDAEDLILAAAAPVWARLEDKEAIRVADILRINKQNKPKFHFDVTIFHRINSKSGIQRVVSNIIDHLGVYDDAQHEVSLIYRDFDGYYRYASANDYVSDNEGDIADIRYGDKIVFLDLDLELSTNARAKNYVTRLHGVERIFVIYDLLPFHMPPYFEENFQEIFVSWLHFVAETSDAIVAISDAVRQEFRDYLDSRDISNRLKLDYFHLGSDIKPAWGEMTEAEQQTVECLDGGGSEIFLAVSTVEPRKGYNTLLDAFDRLWADDDAARLVIVGKAGWKTDDLQNRIRKHAEFGKRLFWFDGASDKALLAVYARADCLISASEGEGFGLPLIEAAQHGVSLIVSDLPVFKEIVQDNGLYFKTSSQDDLASAVRRFRDLRLKNSVPDSGRIDRLTWDESARQLRDAVVGSTDSQVYDNVRLSD